MAKYESTLTAAKLKVKRMKLRTAPLIASYRTLNRLVHSMLRSIKANPDREMEIARKRREKQLEAIRVAELKAAARAANPTKAEQEEKALEIRAALGL